MTEWKVNKSSPENMKNSSRKNPLNSRSVFILVPSPYPTGPIKGAIALANALALSCRVTLVFLKDGPGASTPLAPSVKVVSLATISMGLYPKLRVYRRLLMNAGGRSVVRSISMCLSADLLNRFCRSCAVTICSVRGNLFKNYKFDYGFLGGSIAYLHLRLLASFDHVIAVTDAMSRQIRKITTTHSKIIGNFVDERFLDRYRVDVSSCKADFRFVFVGSLSARKQPQVVLEAFEILLRQGMEIQLDIIGGGPLKSSLEERVFNSGYDEKVRIHGHLSDPYPLIARADVFVLPSASEGVSRAAMEALYLGVPCVLRNVDGNVDLLRSHESGAVFN